ncbi:MAG: hypothetical protein ACREYF_25035 [Gammaproteobacteria bacterium]
MYFKIHSGCSSHPWDSPLRGLRAVSLPAKRSCAPAERDLPSLATVFSQTLTAEIGWTRNGRSNRHSLPDTVNYIVANAFPSKAVMNVYHVSFDKLKRQFYPIMQVAVIIKAIPCFKLRRFARLADVVIQDQQTMNRKEDGRWRERNEQ